MASSLAAASPRPASTTGDPAFLPGPDAPPDGGQPPRGRSSQAGRFYAFLLGLGTKLQVNLIGYIPFSEIALLVLFPLTFSRAYSPANLRKTGWMVPLCFVWLASALLTDAYRGTQWSLAARGIARVTIYCIALPQIVMFFASDGFKKAVWFTAGTIPSILLSQYIFRGGVHEGRERVYGKALFDFESHWSMVLGAVIALAYLLLYQRSRLLAHATTVATGVIQIANGSRSAGMFFLLGSLLCMLKRRLGGALLSKDIISSALKVAVLVGIFSVASYTIYSAYSDAAASGQLGDRAQKKYLRQAASQLGLLLGGRTEFVAGSLAVLRSPIIGYGSWPIDRDGFYYQACELAGMKPDPNFYRLGYPLIPTHSHVLCAWVENGIGGLLFWAYLILFYVRQIIRPVCDEKRLGLYLAVGVVSLLWHIFFSPMAGRIDQCVFIALIANDAFALKYGAAQRRAPDRLRAV